MTAYRRGVYREKQVGARMRANGYAVVESRGSHGAADLIAIKAGQCLMIQVKSGDASLRGAWLNELYLAARDAGATPIVADWPERGLMRLRRITGLHESRSRGWPLVDFTIDEVGAPAPHPIPGKEPHP